MADARQRWDAKYSRGPGSLDHAQILDELEALIPVSGTAVDVGGGTGRNALWLARRGLATTIVDVSPVGLDHARRAAAAAHLDIETIERDVESDGVPQGRTWDVVFMHLFFDRALLADLPMSVAPGGFLVFAQPTVTNLERHASPSERFLLGSGQIAEIADAMVEMDVIQADERWRASGRHEGRLIARRRA